MVTEVNLAAFYLSGVYYNLANRILSIRHVRLCVIPNSKRCDYELTKRNIYQLSSIPPNPQSRPPSYSLLGVLIGMRLLYRLMTFARPYYESTIAELQKDTANPQETSKRETYIDAQPVSLLTLVSFEDDTRPEVDNHTMLDTTLLSSQEQAIRRCALCLEERMESCATECGHLYCWRCVVGWAQEKVRTVRLSISINPNKLCQIACSPSVLCADKR